MFSGSSKIMYSCNSSTCIISLDECIVLCYDTIANWISVNCCIAELPSPGLAAVNGSRFVNHHSVLRQSPFCHLPKMTFSCQATETVDTQQRYKWVIVIRCEHFSYGTYLSYHINSKKPSKSSNFLTFNF